MSRRSSIVVLAIAASVASGSHLGGAEAGTFRTRAKQKQAQEARASRGGAVERPSSAATTASLGASRRPAPATPVERTGDGGQAAAKRFFDSNQAWNLGADWSPVSAPPPVISVDVGTPPQTMRY